MNTTLSKLAAGSIFCFGHDCFNGPAYEKLGDKYVKCLTPLNYSDVLIGPRYITTENDSNVTFLRRTTRHKHERD